jgi:hypothetical protein
VLAGHAGPGMWTKQYSFIDNSMWIKQYSFIDNSMDEAI